MRKLMLPLVLVAAPTQAEPTELAPGVALPAGVVLETRADGDFNGDGLADIAYVAHDEQSRALTVLLSVGHGSDFAYQPESLALDPAGLTPATLDFDGTVLRLEEMSGGTSAIASTRRFRYDGRGERMRLIGLDAALYRRTSAHDGFEASWNLLNGDATTRELRRVPGAGEAAYRPVVERSFKRRIRAQWLSDSPDPGTVLEEMRDG